MSLQIGDSPRFCFFKAPYKWRNFRTLRETQVTGEVFFFFSAQAILAWSDESAATDPKRCSGRLAERQSTSERAAKRLSAAVQLWMFPWNLSPPFIGHLGDEADHHGY